MKPFDVLSESEDPLGVRKALPFCRTDCRDILLLLKEVGRGLEKPGIVGPVVPILGAIGHCFLEGPAHDFAVGETSSVYIWSPIRGNLTSGGEVRSVCRSSRLAK